MPVAQYKRSPRPARCCRDSNLVPQNCGAWFVAALLLLHSTLGVVQHHRSPLTAAGNLVEADPSEPAEHLSESDKYSASIGTRTQAFMTLWARCPLRGERKSNSKWD